MKERLSNGVKLEVKRLSREELVQNIQYAADRVDRDREDLQMLLDEYHERYVASPECAEDYDC